MLYAHCELNLRFYLTNEATIFSVMDGGVVYSVYITLTLIICYGIVSSLSVTILAPYPPG